MPYRELTEWPLEKQQVAGFARIGDLLQLEAVQPVSRVHRLWLDTAELAGIAPVMRPAPDSEIAACWDSGRRCFGRYPLGYAEALELSRERQSAWQKGWCYAERVGADVF